MGYKRKTSRRDSITSEEQIKTIRLGNLARVYQGADRILTGDPVVVNIVDDGPAPAWSDGASITLNAKFISEMDIETLTQVNGLNYHELCHHLYTPRKGTPLVQWVMDNSFFSAFNVLEDQRIETLLTARYPSIVPFLEATVLRYLADTPMEAIANYIVVRGRRYLPVEVRQGFRDIFYKPELIPDIIRIVDEYRLLAFPRDYEKAKQLVQEFHEKVMKHVDINMSGGPSQCGHRAPVQKGRPEPGKMQERDAKRAGNMGKAESDYIPDLRGLSSLEKQELEEEAKHKESMQGNGNTSKQEESEGNSPVESIGLEPDEALKQREHSVYTTPSIGKGHVESAGGLPDDLLSTLENALNSVYDRKDVITDVKRKQKIVIGKTDKFDDAGEHGKFDLSPIPSSALVTYTRFAKELQKLRDDAEPFWQKEVPSGRININRVMRGCEVDSAFDRWTEQDDSVDIEAVICIDRSGSMSSGRNDQLASISCWTIKRALEHIGAPVTVYAFDDKTEVAYERKEKALRSHFKFIYGNGGTEPYESLLQAEKLLLTSPKANKMLFVITDGMFYGDRNDEVIARISKRGVLTSVVLIMNERDYNNAEERNKVAIANGNKPDWDFRHNAEIFGRVNNGADLVTFARSVVLGSIIKKSRR
jgi:hypothetical protein